MTLAFICMAITALPNLGTQVERALKAWLVECGAGTAGDIFISNDSRRHPENGVYTTIVAQTSMPVEETSGNERVQVVIQHFFPASVQPGNSNIESHRLAIDRRVGLQMAALQQSDDTDSLAYTWKSVTTYGRLLASTGSAQSQENNADMVNFTCQLVRYAGSTRGRPEDEEKSWVEVRNYEVRACSSNVD